VQFVLGSSTAKPARRGAMVVATHKKTRCLRVMYADIEAIVTTQM
jgi:hypothetical protein